MKILLTLYLCSTVAGACLEGFEWPETYPDMYDCMVAGYNISIDKIESIGQMLDAETRAWQRVALGLGWRDWQLGVGSEEELKKLEAIKIQPMKVGGIKIKPFKIK